MFCKIRVRLGGEMQALSAKVVVSCEPCSARTLKTRHFCSEMPERDSIRRTGSITLSRARINAIGSDRAVDGRGFDCSGSMTPPFPWLFPRH